MFTDECNFLGTTIKKGTIAPMQRHLEAILNMAVPKDKSEVRRLLGLINYVKHIIPESAPKLQPIYMLLRKKTDFKMGEAELNSIKMLKHCLTNPPVLHAPVTNGKFQLYVDGSLKGLGSILYQKVNDELRIIGYASKPVDPNLGKRVSVTELELMALHDGLMAFKCYLYGPILFDVFTDHHSLLGIFRGKTQAVTRRISRLMSKVNEFNFDLHYVKGIHNEIADMLSRMSHVTDTEQIRNSDGTMCYMTNEGTTVRKSRRLQGLQPEVALTSQIVRRKKRAKSTQPDHSPVTIEPLDNYTPSIPKNPVIVPQLRLHEPPESHKMHLNNTATVDVRNDQRFGHERELYTPQPQDPLQNSQNTFTDKFHGSVPHRVRNKMRDLTSKSYSLDIDQQIIKVNKSLKPKWQKWYLSLRHS